MQNKYDDTEEIIINQDSIEYKEKTADEIFEELGYYKDFDETKHEYRKENEGDLFEIDFWLKERTVSKNYYREMGYITMQELQAINKKCKELGWLDE